MVFPVDEKDLIFLAIHQALQGLFEQNFNQLNPILIGFFKQSRHLTKKQCYDRELMANWRNSLADILCMLVTDSDLNSLQRQQRHMEDQRGKVNSY